MEDNFSSVDPCSQQAVDPRYTRVISSKPSWSFMISQTRPLSGATGPHRWKSSFKQKKQGKKKEDMLCSFNDALNCRNSVERTVFVCSRDVIYGLMFSASLQPFAGTRDAAAHGICSHGHWGMNITMCHSRARWHPTVKSLDMKGMRRAEETGEVDGLYKRKKKILIRRNTLCFMGCFLVFVVLFFFCFTLLL